MRAVADGEAVVSDLGGLVCVSDRLSVSSGVATVRAEMVWGALRGMDTHHGINNNPLMLD